MGEKSGKKRCAEITVCCDIFFSFAWQYISSNKTTYPEKYTLSE
ncbi:hypothetical protein AC95_2440 [Escherichia coli 2-052-05_S4_C2]|nr:hypothetical protein AC95_2440 [Escherichia coli 2-052-05_S4_C2]